MPSPAATGSAPPVAGVAGETLMNLEKVTSSRRNLHSSETNADTATVNGRNLDEQECSTRSGANDHDKVAHAASRSANAGTRATGASTDAPTAASSSATGPRTSAGVSSSSAEANPVCRFDNATGSKSRACLALWDETESEDPHELQIPPRILAPEHRGRERYLLRRLWTEKERAEQLTNKLETYRRSVTDYEQKEREFVYQMEAQMDQWEAQEKAMSMKLQTLEMEKRKLTLWCEEAGRVQRDARTEADELREQHTESERRVQFLMDRLVSLLSASGSTEKEAAVEKDVLQALNDREKELVARLQRSKTDVDQVRQQNRDLALRLTEEQKLSARLHATFCDLQMENFEMRGTLAATKKMAASTLSAGIDDCRTRTNADRSRLGAHRIAIAEDFEDVDKESPPESGADPSREPRQAPASDCNLENTTNEEVEDATGFTSTTTRGSTNNDTGYHGTASNNISMTKTEIPGSGVAPSTSSSGPSRLPPVPTGPTQLAGHKARRAKSSSPISVAGAAQASLVSQQRLGVAQPQPMSFKMNADNGESRLDDKRGHTTKSSGMIGVMHPNPYTPSPTAISSPSSQIFSRAFPPIASTSPNSRPGTLTEAQILTATKTASPSPSRLPAAVDQESTTSPIDTNSVGGFRHTQGGTKTNRQENESDSCEQQEGSATTAAGIGTRPGNISASLARSHLVLSPVGGASCKSVFGTGSRDPQKSSCSTAASCSANSKYATSRGTPITDEAFPRDVLGSARSTDKPLAEVEPIQEECSVLSTKEDESPLPGTQKTTEGMELPGMDNFVDGQHAHAGRLPPREALSTVASSHRSTTIAMSDVSSIRDHHSHSMSTSKQNSGPTSSNISPHNLSLVETSGVVGGPFLSQPHHDFESGGGRTALPSMGAASVSSPAGPSTSASSSSRPPKKSFVAKPTSSPAIAATGVTTTASSPNGLAAVATLSGDFQQHSPLWTHPAGEVPTEQVHGVCAPPASNKSHHNKTAGVTSIPGDYLDQQALTAHMQTVLGSKSVQILQQNSATDAEQASAALPLHDNSKKLHMQPFSASAHPHDVQAYTKQQQTLLTGYGLSPGGPIALPPPPLWDAIEPLVLASTHGARQLPGWIHAPQDANALASPAYQAGTVGQKQISGHRVASPLQGIHNQLTVPTDQVPVRSLPQFQPIARQPHPSSATLVSSPGVRNPPVIANVAAIAAAASGNEQPRRKTLGSLQSHGNRGTETSSQQLSSHPARAQPQVHQSLVSLSITGASAVNQVPTAAIPSTSYNEAGPGFMPTRQTSAPATNTGPPSKAGHLLHATVGIAGGGSTSSSSSTSCATSEAGPTPNSGRNSSNPTITRQHVMEMERQLRDVLDAASFDRAVIRVGNGIYNFGSDRCILRLDVDNRVLASSGDDGASFIPVADFIRKLSTTPTPIQEQGVEENAAGATTAGVRRTSSLQDAGATPQGPPATSTVQRKGILNYQQPKLTSVSIGSPQLSANRMAAMEPMPFYAQPHRSTSSEPVVKDKPFVGGGVSSRPSEVLSLAGRQSREASPQPVVGDAMRSWVGRERQAGPPVSQILLNFGQPPRTLSASPLRTTQQTRRHP